jgi:hypothetical protein
MKWRSIALIPFAATAVTALVAETLPSWCWLSLFALAYALAAVESGRAARLFARGERLHWAWLLMCVAYAIGFVGRLVVGGDTGVPTMSPLVGTVWSAITILLNLAGVAALVMFSRVWAGTGLEPRWRIHVTLLMLALGCAVDGRACWTAAVALVGGDRQSLGLLVSSVSDIGGIALIGPVFATALALRGGLLVWPWALQFASSLFWLVDDATVFLPGRWSARVDLWCRMIAVLLAFSAARAQRWVRESLDEPGAVAG